ncbi:hypothetical protein PSEUBRA_003438 [Kalmanozyma brasiliensis GHG001]|uniref:AB hydrolase-1 domain-containing protein n=1 Tax=Kalmanozyma brasiliensis (strain GHG001) TaxID=1365824 RepID=V5EXM3_KALBG|nr:uncharacterized protein PSEUBRA_003438 [Kalmanozyma brasiliensis GHG001]EST07259.1 hypothetical protein PSEUBRA_003438 [Kalmanozyma brasiliensis GHG001]
MASSTSASRRENITFASGDDVCAGWLYRPTAPPLAPAYGSIPSSRKSKYPAVVLGHGIGGIKEFQLDAYSERFAELGIICVAFDYRHFGESGGQPRQLLDIGLQQQDWRAAIRYTKQLEEVDETRVGLFGSSFGGGHVIHTSSEDHTIKAVIAQCPFTSGFHSAQTVGVLPLFKLAGLGIWDLVSKATGYGVIPVPLAGKPGEAALMNTPDAMDYEKIIPPFYLAQKDKLGWVAARFALNIGFYNPGWKTADIQCPILFGVCGKDSVAPPGPTIRYAANALHGEVKVYDDMGHFDCYVGEPFEIVTKDYCDFLRRNL